MEVFSRIAGKIEERICLAALALMSLLPVMDAILRPFNIVIPNSRFFLLRFFLISALFAAMLCTRKNEHISIALLQFIKNEKIKQFFLVFTFIVSVFVTTVFFWNSISFIQYSLFNRTGTVIPEWIFALALPIAYFVLTIRFFIFSVSPLINKDRKTWFFYFLPLASLILGCIAAMPAIVKIIWGMEGELSFTPPVILYDLVNNLYDGTFSLRTPLILFFIFAALSGTPIFIAIGGIGLVIIQSAFLEPDAGAIQVYSALTNTDIMAIPLFTLTGFFLSESKAGERLVAAFKSLFSWLPGGMVIATVIICAFFTSFTGASGVTILALGGILYTILNEKSGYPEKFSIGLLTSAGNVGLLFPPSLIIILVASTSTYITVLIGNSFDYSIIDFFIGAIIPGIILVLSRIIFGLSISIKVKIPVEPFKPKEALKAIKGSIYEILLPIILVTGYLTGILPSLVEISAVSVIYVFIIEVFVHKDIPVKNIVDVFMKAVPIIGGILIILSMAQVLSYGVIDIRVPEYFAEWMRTAVESRILFLLLLNLALIILGCFMDIFSAILVVLPLIIPLAHVYDIHPIHLGVIFIINMEMGYLTPPVGLNLYLASYRFNKPFLEICRYVLPFLLMQLVVVLIVTYIPSLSTFLVYLFK